MQLPDPLAGPPVITVAALALYLRDLLETNDILNNIWIQGEVSNHKAYPSGHCYFTLKDGDAQLPCVFFKSSRLRSASPDLSNGMAIAANGRVSFYERDGKLQFYVEAVKPLGEGLLFQRFEQLKMRLAAEGLFDAERKRPLPSYPSLIGIVTSPQAAALRDMLRVLRVRYPLARVLLVPTQVQGAEAPASIASAIELLNEHGEADVMIVGRGGGSIEELWAFNEEVVARAIANSRIPVISGVGHETDITISDLVADYRASTPTAAATAAVPDIADGRALLAEHRQQLMEIMRERLEELRRQVALAERDLTRSSPRSLIERRRQQLDEYTERMHIRLQHILSLRTERLRGSALRLHSLSPLLTIARGYAIVRRDRDQQIISSVQQVQSGEELTIQVQDGTIPVVVYDQQRQKE